LNFEILRAKARCGNGPQTAQEFNPPYPRTARGRHRDFAESDSKRFKFDAVMTKLLAGPAVSSCTISFVVLTKAGQLNEAAKWVDFRDKLSYSMKTWS
jgi:hypothetical protein